MALVLLMVVAAARSVELPPEIATDRLLVRADRQTQEGEHRAALATMNEIPALAEEPDLTVPDGVWFLHAQAASDVDEHAQAVESATRYVTAVGWSGEHYRAALELLDTSEAELRVGEVFADALQSGGRGPAMVTIPAGTFRMGCLTSEQSCDSVEMGFSLPAHRVTIDRRFALSVYEVTFDEWDACVAAGGCGGYEPSDQDWGRGTRPVVAVS